MTFFSARARFWWQAVALVGATSAMVAACSSSDGVPGPSASTPTRSVVLASQPLEVARNVAAGHAGLARLFEEPAAVPFRLLGSAFVPAPERLGKVLQIDAEIPDTAQGKLSVRAFGDQAHSLLVEPLSASSSRAELTDDGRVLYRAAFGSADLITTVSERELNQTLVLKDDQAPAIFAWKLTAGQELAGHDSSGLPLRSLRPHELEDGRTAFLDENAKVRLFLQQALIRDAAGHEHSAPVIVAANGQASLAVDYQSLTLPAVVSISFLAPTVGVFSLPPPPTVIKGRLMLMLDNSGSMMQNFAASANAAGDSNTSAVFCDNDIGTNLGKTFNCTQNVACTLANGGRNLFPYSVAAGPSKIFAAKAAIQNVVNAHSGLIDFGLTRFYEPPLATCPNSLYCCNPQINATTPGRCTPAANSYPNWSVTPARTTGSDLTYAGTSCGLDDDHGGRILVSPSGTSGPQVIRWVDYVEDFCSSTGVVGGAPRNPEIRASNSGTPDARAVRSMRLQWYRPIFNVSKVGQPTFNAADPLYDPQLDCRSYVAVVMTDGQDTCALDLSTEAGGFHGENPTNPPIIWALGMGAPAGLDVTELNQTMVAGGAGTTAPIAQNQQQIEAAFADIVASTVKFETCNGKDDNCNVSIDEGLGVYQECALGTECGSTTCNAGRCTCTSDVQCAAGYLCGQGAGTRFCRPACTVGVGTCNKSGVKKCGSGNGCCANDAAATCTALVAGTPGTETCNGLDDDCNGIIDDVPGGCQKTCTPEVCNGVDDDCNGIIDDNLTDVGQPCGQPLIGICKPGTSACQSGVLKCSGGTPAGTETCNGLDDDCDGVVDGMTFACYSGTPGTQGVGICRGGTQACTATAGSGVDTRGPCVGQVTPAVEVCNGLDDDCNGLVDDVPTVGNACCPSGNCNNLPCKAGTLQCSGGSVQCIGAVGPSPETCNGIDDDCNGIADDVPGLNSSCCPSGNCGVGVCVAGTKTCQGTQLVCQNATGPGTEVCNLLDDDCDGQVDNLPGAGAACCPAGVPCGVGICKKGTMSCTANGPQLTCTGFTAQATETCNTLDDDCNGLVDDVPGAGASCCTSAPASCNVGVCKNGVQKCQGNGLACVNEVKPGVETCNGLDDDCNGVVDDVPNLGASCCPYKDAKGNPLCGTGICQRGVLSCVAGANLPQCTNSVGPQPETCDTLDNDCNGIVDDLPGGTVGGSCFSGDPAKLGVGICHAGTLGCGPKGVLCLGEQGPMGEQCNGIDDDCNGTVDDVPGLGTTCCTSGRCGVGICTGGHYACNGTALTCQGENAPQVEVCNGIDDDCNGVIDDVPELGQSCCPNGSPAPDGCNKGICRPGTFKCSGTSLVCDKGVGKTDETCNGLDDDCDGTIDDGVDIALHDPRVGIACDVPTAPNDHPPCAPGQSVCQGGKVACTGQVKGKAEICDGKDDDCDGVADNQAACPKAGQACVAGICASACSRGEFPCPGGYVCDNGYCVPPGAVAVGGAGNQGGGASGGSSAGGASSPSGGVGTGGNTSHGGGDAGGSAGASTAGSSASGAVGAGASSGAGTSPGGNAGSDPTGSAGLAPDGRRVFGLATGGGGCACRVSPSPLRDGRAFAWLGAAIGLMAIRRSRRRAA